MSLWSEFCDRVKAKSFGCESDRGYETNSERSSVPVEESSSSFNGNLEYSDSIVSAPPTLAGSHPNPWRNFYQESIQQAAIGLLPTCIDKDNLAKFVKNGEVSVKKFLKYLEKQGINVMRDPRLKMLADSLSPEGTVETSFVRNTIPIDDFEEIARPSASIINQALSSELIIPDFFSFSNTIKQLYQKCKPVTHGQTAQYIPQLARVSPDIWAVSICTVDGQRVSFGDHTIPFTVQSIRDVIVYAAAVTELGETYVHNHVGKEPKNCLNLGQQSLPHNPFVPPGVLAVISLLKPDLSLSDRYDYIHQLLTKLSGYEEVGFSNGTFLAEKNVADSIYAMAYHLMEHKVFPVNTDIDETIDLYLQLCSLEINADSGAIVAATLANGGICPLTSEAIFSPTAVRNSLSLLRSCGIYCSSGEWSFDVGLAAKASVSGSIMIIIPDVMGIMLHSPLLTKERYSCRGWMFSKSLSQQFQFYDGPSTASNKICPVKNPNSESKQVQVVNLIIAAKQGDMPQLIKYFEMNINFNWKDYDGRTALHYGVIGGHLNVVRFLVKKCEVDIQIQDKWGNTPLDEAIRRSQSPIVRFLLAQNHFAPRHRSDSSRSGGNMDTI